MSTLSPSQAGSSVAHKKGASRWTSLIGVGLRAKLSRRVRLLSDINYWTTSTARLQARQLRRLVGLAEFTEFGRTHDFTALSRLADADLIEGYRKNVPLADYYAFRTLVARMREGGEPDLLWPGLVMDYAQTSGTTAGDKYIPVSKQMMRSNYLAALDIFANAIRFGVSLPRILAGRVVFLGGSTDLSVNEHGIRTGDLSGLVTPMIRWPLTEIYAPGKQIALMSHWPSKIEAMAEHCIDLDVRMMNGMPSWGLVLMERVISLARERGRNVSTIREVWPNFELFVHGGVKYSPFEARVRQVFSGSPDGADIPNRLELYPASEGFIAIQDTKADPGLRMLSDIGNFYEFVPLEQIDDPAAPAFTADTVEKGQKYVVVMSTCAGLWRYIIGDVVEFDGAPRGLDGRGGWSASGPGASPSRMRIVGRHRHFINAFGENIIVEHIENAVAAAAKRTGLIVGEFTAAPVYPGSGRRSGLELAVELQRRDVPPTTIDAFRDAFDAAVKEQNVDYTTKRTDNLGMAPPTVTVLPVGAFHEWLRSRGKIGGQHKCPRCANTREILEAVVAAGRI